MQPCLDWALAVAVFVCCFKLSNKLLYNAYYTILLVVMLQKTACALPEVMDVASLEVGRVISGAILAASAASAVGSASSAPRRAKRKKTPQATASSLVSSINSYASALSFHPSSLLAIIIVILVRVSPDEWIIIFQNSNDGTCQIIQSIMFVDLLEELFPGLTFDIYPGVCKTQGGSRHNMSTCPGLNQLYNILLHLRKKHPSNPVLVIAKDSVRFTSDPDAFDAIGTSCATIHPGSEIVTVDEAFLPLFGINGMRHLRFIHDQALRAFSATIGSHRDITKSLEDTRTEEEIEFQNDILSLSLQLNNNLPAQLKLDIARAALIGQRELLSEYASALIGMPIVDVFTPLLPIPPHPETNMFSHSFTRKAVGETSARVKPSVLFLPKTKEYIVLSRSGLSL